MQLKIFVMPIKNIEPAEDEMNRLIHAKERIDRDRKIMMFLFLDHSLYHKSVRLVP